MKYVYIVLALALIAGGYYVFSSHEQAVQDAASIPNGYHRMSDGTLMKNEPEGTMATDSMSGMQVGQ